MPQENTYGASRKRLRCLKKIIRTGLHSIGVAGGATWGGLPRGGLHIGGATYRGATSGASRKFFSYPLHEFHSGDEFLNEQERKALLRNEQERKALLRTAIRWQLTCYYAQRTRAKQTGIEIKCF